MKKSEKAITEKFILRNMLCHCCVRLISLELGKIGVQTKSKHLGEVDVTYDPDRVSKKEITNKLKEIGFEVVQNRKKQLVEQVKAAITDLVHHTTFNAMVKNSDYLVEKFAVSYQYLSGLFSKYENVTLEKYIILHKIEKVKELIQQGEFTLSEIAYMMGYSSVQYLSTQFKNITGVSVTDFKKEPSSLRKSIDEINYTDSEQVCND